MTIVYTQDFESTAVGSLPVGFTQIVGSTWQTTANGRIPSGIHALVSPGTDGSIIAYTGTGVPTATADMELRYDVGYDGSFPCAFVRGDATLQNGYVFTLVQSNFQEFKIYKRISGTFTQLTDISTGDTNDYTAGAGKVSLRVNITGNVLKIRWWIFDTTEPLTWQINFTLDGSITTGGYVGWYFVKPGGGSGSTIDNIKLDDLEAAAATDFTLSPSNQNTAAGVSTGNYTLTPNGLPSSATEVTLSDGGAGGAFTPLSLSLTTASSETFTYTPASDASGPITLTATVSGGFSSSHSVTATVPNAASDFTVTPASHTTTPSTATGSYQVGLNGAIGANVSIALSDGGAGGAFSPAGPLVFTPGNAGTAQDVAYTPPGGSGGTTIALGFSASGAITASHFANCVVATGPVTVPVNDPNVFFSPYNWRLSGSGFAVSACNGAYIKMGFSGTSIKVTLNISGYAALYGNTALWPKVRWSIDDGAAVDRQLTPGDATLTLATDLTAGTHRLYFCLVSTTDGYDRWVGPGSAVILTGFILDGGAGTVAPALADMRVLFFGDSITEGVKTTGQTSSGDISNNDSQLEWCAMLGKAFPAEYGQVGYGGLGWVSPSAGGSPPGAVPFFTPGSDALSSWDKYSQGQPRLVSGLFSPAPDIVCIMLGANDRTQPADAVQASVTAALPAIRAAAPDAWIFVVYEVTTQNQKAAVLAGFDAYQATAPDDKCAIVDCGIEAHFNFSDVPTDMAADGIHPAFYATGQIAGIVMKQIRDAMQGTDEGGGTVTTAGYSRARVANE